MKLSKISLALVAVCGSIASAPSFALPASQYTNTSEFVGDTLNIRISGATAQDNGVLGSALSYCTPGSVHRYQISNNFAFFCTPDIGSGPGQILVPPGRTKVAIYKYSAGGSGNGVDPVNLNQTLPFLDLAKIATSPACSGSNLTTSMVDFDGPTSVTNTGAASTIGQLAPYVNNICSAGGTLLTTGATTYIGLSDVEPAFFTNNTTNLASEVLSSLIFSPIVSLNIRNALQAQQGLTVGSDTEANMPSLSRSQLVSIFTQAGQTWSGIGVTTSNGVTDPFIYVSRRVDTSGTQKTFEALLARSPNGQPFKNCNTSTDLFVTPTSGSVLTGDAVGVCSGTTASSVHAGSGGGDTINCLLAHHTGGRGAVGIQTAESVPGSANWRYVRVDGRAPTHANVASGQYTLYTDTSINTRTNVNPTAAALGYSDFLTRFIADLKNPAIIRLINAPQTFGSSGLMASYVSGTPDYTGASAINPFNRLVGGTDIDNCQAGKAPF